MRYKVELTDEAKQDIEASYDYYEERSAGLGDRFEQDVNEAIEAIAAIPEGFPVKYNGYRAAVLKVFPYIIYYVFMNPVVRIIQVFHTSQDPAKRR